MSKLPFRLISGDSHIVEPPNLWLERMDRQHRDRAPRIERQGNQDVFLCEGAIAPKQGIGLVATKAKYADPDAMGFDSRGGLWSEVPEGSYDPIARLVEMDAEGVEAELLYPTFGLTMYTIPDAPFQHACFRAFNDWLADFCKASPKRLFGVAMIPPNAPEAALEELRRCARMGLRGAMISITPDEMRGYTHPDYAPFWSAAEEFGMPISLHVAASTGSYLQTGNHLADFSLGFAPTMFTVAGMIVSGLLDQHPKLKVISVENDAAWPLPMLERMDDRLKYDQGWAGRYNGMSSGRKPSEVFHQQVACTFMRDRTAILNRAIIGRENIMWGSDYPHFDGGWPQAADRLAAQLDGVPLEDQILIGRGNAIAFYGLPLVATPSLAAEAAPAI